MVKILGVVVNMTYCTIKYCDLLSNYCNGEKEAIA